jgi:hypothetical protein
MRPGKGRPCPDASRDRCNPGAGELKTYGVAGEVDPSALDLQAVQPAHDAGGGTAAARWIHPKLDREALVLRDVDVRIRAHHHAIVDAVEIERGAHFALRVIRAVLEEGLVAIDVLVAGRACLPPRLQTRHVGNCANHPDADFDEIGETVLAVVGLEFEDVNAVRAERHRSERAVGIAERRDARPELLRPADLQRVGQR